MLQSADPAWRLTDWLLAFEVVGLTLCGLYLAGGEGCFRRYAFPICFFLVAVPWLYPVEKWLIQRLTFSASAATVEALGILGVPAIAHGSVIEVGTGMVGIDEACSGIRSFQSSLMISLFLGALYALPKWRRILLVPIGFVLSFFFNVCRTSFLAWIAAKKGVGAIGGYHDQAGMAIVFACTSVMWIIAIGMKKPRTRIDVRCEASQTSAAQLKFVASIPKPLTVSSRVGPIYAFIGWLALVEFGVAVWSHSGAAAAGSAARWSIAWPIENATFRKVEPDRTTSNLLQYDEAQQAQWSEADGSTWSAFYFNWLPGRVGAYLVANRHSPDICMTYAGWEIASGPDSALLEVRNLHLPFKRYSFTQGTKTVYVFHCRWEPAFEINPGLAEQQSKGSTLHGFSGLSILWTKKGKGGQKILEVIVEGYGGAEEAQAALVRQLEKLVNVEETKY
jgi:exosortase